MSAEIRLKLKSWIVPNFVSVERPPRPRQEGPTFDEGIPLAELDESALAILCDEFRAGVFAKAGKADPAVKWSDIEVQPRA